MAEFLSDEWIAALDTAARADRELRIEGRLVVEQVVRASDGPDQSYQVRFGPDGTSVSPGRAALADVVLVTDRETAWALHRGARRTQDAFASGDLKLRGRPELLSGHSTLFVRFREAMSSVRQETTPAVDR
jgi:hypothetical protein